MLVWWREFRGGGGGKKEKKQQKRQQAQEPKARKQIHALPSACVLIINLCGNGRVCGQSRSKHRLNGSPTPKSNVSGALQTLASG